VRVRIGNFAKGHLEKNLGQDLAIGLAAALGHYSRRLESSRPPAPPPRFMEEPPEGEAFDAVVEPEVAVALERAAHRLGVSLEAVLRHAVLVYLADLDGVVGEALLSAAPAGRRFEAAPADAIAR
jgi:hypothetical protein